MYPSRKNYHHQGQMDQVKKRWLTLKNKLGQSRLWVYISREVGKTKEYLLEIISRRNPPCR